MERFKRTWELMKQSFAVLRSDKQLMLLPVASGICCLLVSGLLLLGGGLAVSAVALHTSWESPSWLNSVFIWTAILVFYLANYLVIVFFNVALISAASERLAGRPATLRGGLAKAWERKGKVAQWALLAATVGVILRMIENRLGGIGRLVTKLLGAAWALASYFVAPVLAFEGLGPVDALKRSAALFRETWGEELVSQFGIGLVFVLLAVVGVGAWFAALIVGRGTGFYINAALLVLYLLALGVGNAAIEGVFTAALYRFATTKTVPPDFVGVNFSMAWGPKKKSRGDSDRGGMPR
ncbi:MAG: DUF6159 family protein [Candidatus Acidiferrales bacterium]